MKPNFVEVRQIALPLGTRFWRIAPWCAPFGRLDQLALIRFLCPDDETHGAVFGFSSPKS
jgi:hypothetical protein